jgi:kynurenine formamidase
MTRNYVDLSHTIHDGMITHKGLPAPAICDFLSRETSRANYDGGTEFQIGQITMVANTGTYIDCPSHRFAHGKDLSEVGLERFSGLDAVVVRVPHRKKLAIGAEHFKTIDVAGRAVLVHTGWCEYWNTPAYQNDHPYLTEEAAEHLRECGARLVGIDSHNIDDTGSRNSRPVHTILLGHDILVVEHMRGLEQLPDSNFRFSAIPPKVKGMGTFPVRAFAEIG